MFLGKTCHFSSRLTFSSTDDLVEFKQPWRPEIGFKLSHLQSKLSVGIRREYLRTCNIFLLIGRLDGSKFSSSKGSFFAAGIFGCVWRERNVSHGTDCWLLASLVCERLVFLSACGLKRFGAAIRSSGSWSMSLRSMFDCAQCKGTRISLSSMISSKGAIWVPRLHSGGRVLKVCQLVETTYLKVE